MKNHGRSFTFEIDQLLLDQIEARAAVTGRKRSREMAYLIDLAFREIDAGAEEIVSNVGETKRVCVYLTSAIYTRAKQHAQDSHRPTGNAVNILLRTALDVSARRNAAMTDAGRSGPALP